jgi:O-antigen/teichoic acid export membrane protein
LGYIHLNLNTIINIIFNNNFFIILNRRLQKILSHRHFGEILKGGSTILVYRIVAAFITLLLTIEITRRLGAGQSGYYFFIISFLMLLTSFSSFGLYNATIKEVAINVENKAMVSNIMTRSLLLVLLGCAITISAIYAYDYIGVIYGFSHSIINQYFHIVLMSLLPFSLIFLFSSYFQAYKNLFLSIFNMNLGYQLFMLSAFFLFDIETLDEVFTIFYSSLYFVIFVSFAWYLMKHKNSVLIGPNINFSYMLILSTPMMISHIVSQLNNFSGIFLLSIYSTPDDVSLFSVAMRISIVISLVFFALMRISTPKFAVLYKQEKYKELEDVAIFTNKILLIVSIFITCGIIVFGKDLLSLFGTEFIAAYPILIIVTIGQLIVAISGISVFILQMTGFQKVIRNYAIVATSVSIFMGVIIVPIWGIMGAAITTLISLSIVNLSASFKVYRLLSINLMRFF